MTGCESLTEEEGTPPPPTAWLLTYLKTLSATESWHFIMMCFKQMRQVIQNVTSMYPVFNFNTA